MCVCVAMLEEGYRSSNPYHNAVHAVDVAQAMHCYINEYRVRLHLHTSTPVLRPREVNVNVYLYMYFALLCVALMATLIHVAGCCCQVSQFLSPLEKLIAIFSALAHDVEHPGVNNAFLIATSNHLAKLYSVSTHPASPITALSLLPPSSSQAMCRMTAYVLLPCFYQPKIPLNDNFHT